MKNHSPGFLALITEAKKTVPEITPQELKRLIADNKPCSIIDVREEHEWADGRIMTAIHLSKGVIERDIEKTIPDTNTKIVLYCRGGNRSLLAAENLQKMGYKHVYSLAEGSAGWLEAGYELVSK